MDEAARSRRAAREAVTDVEPLALREDIETILADGSMAPGALTLLSVRATDESADLEHLADRAAGVQLIYEGLKLTRTLAHEEPWDDAADQTDPNVDVLAADVLVSRGFYLLARTDAAGKAVETVRSFGRDQTRRNGDTPQHGALERDVLELAIIAGTTAVGGDPATLLPIATSLADAAERPLPAAEAFLPDTAGLRTRARAHADATLDDGARPSATDS